MANSLKSIPLDAIAREFEKAGFTPQGVRLITDFLARISRTISNKAEIQSVAPVTGRTEGLGTTVQNLNSTGQLNTFTNVAAGRTTDNLTDGTGSPLTGGKRGFIALDTNNRLAGTFRSNPVNVAAVPTSSTTLSNDGISTSITIAASTDQYGDGSVSYNSGS